MKYSYNIGKSKSCMDGGKDDRQGNNSCFTRVTVDFAERTSRE